MATIAVAGQDGHLGLSLAAMLSATDSERCGRVRRSTMRLWEPLDFAPSCSGPPAATASIVTRLV